MSDEKAGNIDLSKLRKGGAVTEMDSALVEELERTAKDLQAVQILRLNLIDTWNALEDSLAELLRVSACMPDPVAASILYFSPHSFSTRLQMINRLIEHLVISGAKDPAIIREWRGLSEKLKSPKSARDLAAHGSITTYHVTGKNHVRLCATMGQLHVHLQSFRDEKLPGKGIVELQHAVDAINSRIKLVKDFRSRLATS